VPEVSSSGLTLPEEFLLLCHLPHGKVRKSDVVAAGCAAAEFGDLALRGRLRGTARKKTTIFGMDGYVLPGKIQLLDTRPTGVAWADALLVELERRGAVEAPVGATRLVRRRRKDAMALHRESLLSRGVLQSHGRRWRHYPDEGARNALVGRLQAVCDEQIPVDAHMLLLLELLEAADMWKPLGLGLGVRQRIAWARGIGLVANVPADIRETSAVIFWDVPNRTGTGGGFELGGGG
jgi:Golgi phosphoprotein 3 (GPP34)